MAADSDGCSIRTIVTCKGDLADPRFPGQLGRVLSELQVVLGVRPKVHKLEPWNSVRVTLSIPREAALRLRQLANNGSLLLRSLGILSVQVEGDQVISLQLATVNSREPQEIILRTGVQDGSTSGGDNNSLSQILAGAVEATQAATATSNAASSNAANTAAAAAAAAAATAAACAQSVPTTDKVQFRSPNVVCPADSIVPKVPNNNISSSIGINGGLSLPASNAAAAVAAAATVAASIASAGPSTGPFPFTSMNQAIHTHRNLNNNTTTTNNSNIAAVLHPAPLPIVTNNNATAAAITNSISGSSNNSNNVPLNVTSTTVLPPPPPPPYPSVHPPVTLSSPLLVNLLQNEGASSSTNSKVNLPAADDYKQLQLQPAVVGARPNHAIVLVSDTKSVVAHNNVLQHHRQFQLLQHNNTAKAATSSAFTSANAKDNTTTTNCVMSNPSIASTSLSSSASVINGSNVHHNGGGVSTDAIHDNSASISGRSPVPYRPYPPPPLPPPPAYPVATTIQRSPPLWDQQHQQQSMEQQLQDLTPSLTDLKEVDLVHLLPTLESDLAGSPLLDLPDDLICTNDIRLSHNDYLINPLTGELEPHASEAEEDAFQDVFTGLPSPAALLSDEDTNSTIRPDTTDQSDSESRSGHHSSDSSKPQRIKRSKEKGHRSDSPSVSKQSASKTELKLRFKLEKSEPVLAAYKVDYINPNQQKKSIVSMPTVSSTDEPRVPPLHISLRGRNHVVISNKKKVKLNSDGTPLKVKQRTKLLMEQQKLKKTIDEGKGIDEFSITDSNIEIGKKLKRPKLIHDVDVGSSINLQDSTATSIPDKVTAVYNLHCKEKLKERRGSDSELVKINSASSGTGYNGMLNNYKKRRLSQSSEMEESLDQRDSIMPVLGSTNIGTVSSLSNHKQRKFKLKDPSIRMKDINRFKNYNMKAIDKSKQMVVLPTGEIDMEAKIKQRLLEEQSDRRGSISSISIAHRATSVTSATTVVTSTICTTLNSNALSTSLLKDSTTVNNLVTAKRAVVIVEEQKRLVVDDLLQTLEQNTSSPPPLKDKPPPEPDKCNTPDQQQKAKQSIVQASTSDPSTVLVANVGVGNAGGGAPSGVGNNATGNANSNVVSRSPNGGAQGEDSGIESMDALSEKSPNQASQSPHGELPDTSTTVPSNSNHSANIAGVAATSGTTMQCVRSGSGLVNMPTTMPNSTQAQSVVPSIVSVNKIIASSGSSNSISAKSQVPIMLDIEAQLAKMEGLNGADDDVDDDEELEEEEEDDDDDDEEDEEDDDDLQHLGDGDLGNDANENNALIKVDKLSDKQQCCRPSTTTTTTGTTGALLDNRKQVAVMQANNDGNQAKNKFISDESIRITPSPRYTYSSATEKDRNSSSPPPLHLSGNASNTGGSTHPPYKGSLLKQLLIDIPDTNHHHHHHHHHSTRSNSPSTTVATASTSASTITTPSVRTRAASKLNSPELNSPVGGNRQRVLVPTAGLAPVIHTVSSVTTAVTTKRKRYESDGSTSNHSASADDATTNRLKKVRKHSENTAEFIKSCIGTDSKRKKVPEESSDDEQPLIEMAKSKKGPPTPTLSSLSHVAGTAGGLGSMVGMTPRVKLKASAASAAASGAVGATTTTAATILVNNALANKIGPINTRRSIRAIPALNTRSKGDKTNPESDILRRKTRSAVSEGEGKRRKDIK